ncbi:LysR family transcriptional regulator [uncultured Ruegeria sp.]|uniref:LysR family transcriptional regulator n=1 Tax=uncultured Ruegeria sp. TaxID=259304 RepID=UPI002608DB48|nr:LysR family transcriptional regulator [uncultured Ruegeria sp.]
MTLDQLKTFLWVARLGGVRRAALEMNISQPAVSGRIAALEEALGTVLFDRVQRGVTLTKKGVLLQDYAEKISDLVESIKTNIVSEEAVDSLLRIGVAESIVQLWLPTFLSELYEKYPNIKVELVVDLTINLRQQLLERSLDFAVLMGPVSEFSIDNQDLPDIDLAWFRPVSHPDTDFKATPVITYNRNSRPYRELKSELVKRYGNDIQMFPSSSIYAGLEMVASGIGVGLFPKQLGLKLSKQGRIAEFDPGWNLNPLKFTASYVGDPRNDLCADAAKIAAHAAATFLDE